MIKDLADTVQFAEYRYVSNAELEPDLRNSLWQDLRRQEQRLEDTLRTTPPWASGYQHLTAARTVMRTVCEALKSSPFDEFLAQGQQAEAQLRLAQDTVLDFSPHRQAYRTLQQVDEHLERGDFAAARTNLRHVFAQITKFARDLDRATERDGPIR
ncbi:MAG TPA: hypothetical protein VD902_07380 [Symbiobacteriaceae bacterium]|nr:hypothetical protein [Symbiobacteriaceae bacterium]